MGYIYQADVYCDECGEATKRNLAELAPEDPLDHHSYDSDNYPKDADIYWTAEDCKDDGRHSAPGWYSNESY